MCLVHISEDFYSEGKTGVGRYKTRLSVLSIESGEIQDTWLLNDDYNCVHLVDDLLVCASVSGKAVHVHDFKTKELLKTFETDFAVYNAKLSSDRSYTICSGKSDSVCIFDYETENLIKEIKVNSESVYDFAITKDKRCLIVCEFCLISANYHGSLAYFSIDSQECLGRVPCGKFVKRLHIDEAAKSVLTIDNDGVNLIPYKILIPSLIEMCVKKIESIPNFFQNRPITAYQESVLSEHFDIEEDQGDKSKKLS